MSVSGYAFLGILIMFDLVLFYACFKNERETQNRERSSFTRNGPPDASDDSDGRE